jgi:hypothetical protein
VLIPVVVCSLRILLYCIARGSALGSSATGKHLTHYVEEIRYMIVTRIV